MRTFTFVFGLTLLMATPQLAVAQETSPVEPTPDPVSRVCSTIEDAARANGIPIDFLVRLIWQESRFHSGAIGPITRNGQRAQGIAQFMPGTAAERHLVEPYDPTEALPKSGEFLAELRKKFGNLGLAAAAYNAGPGRVSEFMAHSRDLPAETRKDVLAITGRSIEDWLSKLGTNEEDPGNPASGVPCPDLADLLKQSPKLQSQQTAVPSWCLHLHHPNTNVCGTVHEPELPKLSDLAKLMTRLSTLKTSLHN
jgi:hypothetical protein